MEHEHHTYGQDDENTTHHDDSLNPLDPDAQTSEVTRVELEPGWSAMRSLANVGSDELLAAMLRPSFCPVGDFDLVPVTPCAHCRDGGLRTVGTIRTRHGRQRVCACDTCGVVELGEPVPPVEH